VEQALPPGERALVICAHPDDAEYAVGGTIAKLTRAGREVVYCLCTRGDKGSADPNVSPGYLAEVRSAEQLAAARVLGVREVIFLDYEDGVMEPSLALRRDLVRVIRRVRPDIVLVNDPTTRYMGGRYLNHPDHRVVGDAALDAVYPSARDRWVFPELLDEGLEPHKTREVLLWQPPRPDHWVDIADVIDLKIAALREHRSQTAQRDLDTIVRERAALWGRQVGLAYAEAFVHLSLP
jgi:LmbE family N-acetylglucosaminyl deacetylase